MRLDHQNESNENERIQNTRMEGVSQDGKHGPLVLDQTNCKKLKDTHSFSETIIQDDSNASLSHGQLKSLAEFEEEKNESKLPPSQPFL